MTDHEDPPVLDLMTALKEWADKNVCHSCARPTTEDESVVVRPGERYCLTCIKAGKVTNPEPDCDLCGYTPCACHEDVR